MILLVSKLMVTSAALSASICTSTLFRLAIIVLLYVLPISPRSIGVDIKWMLRGDAESSVARSCPAFLWHTRDRASATGMDLSCLYWTWTSNRRHLRGSLCNLLGASVMFFLEDLLQGGVVGFNCHAATEQVILKLL